MPPAAPSFCLESFPSGLIFAKMKRFGLWRSLVARLLGVQEVVSSNLASPTIPHLFWFSPSSRPFVP